jgi:lipoprotein-releasing system permease protein
MIIATSVVTGFKKSITQKMSGVASHITITNLDNNTSFETKPLVKDIGFMNTILQTAHVRHIQSYALKHAIIKTKKEIQGILIKGIDVGFDWEAFSPNMLEGNQIDPKDTNGRNQVMVTKALATAMGLKLGDTLFTYYIAQPRRILRDRVIRDHSSAMFYSMIPKNESGMSLDYTYDTSNPEVFNFFQYITEDSITSTTPRAVKLKVAGIFETGIYELDQQLVIGPIGLVQDMYGWTSNNISGYEIYLDDFENLNSTYQAISFITPQELYPSDIRANYPEIFEWLPAIDVNGIIIIVLMVLVAMMAMLSTLLILIMEKTYIVGILKSLGMNNWMLVNWCCNDSVFLAAT